MRLNEWASVFLNVQLYQMTCCIVHNCMIYPQNEWANAFSNFQHHWMTCCIVHSCAFSLQCLRWPDPSKDLLHCANLFILSPEWSSLWWFRLPALSNLHLPHLKRFFPLLSSHDLVYHQRHSSSSSFTKALTHHHHEKQQKGKIPWTHRMPGNMYLIDFVFLEFSDDDADKRW